MTKANKLKARYTAARECADRLWTIPEFRGTSDPELIKLARHDGGWLEAHEAFMAGAADFDKRPGPLPPWRMEYGDLWTKAYNEGWRWREAGNT